MKVTTHSGTTYLYDNGTLTRLRTDDGVVLRKDGEPIRVLSAPDPVVGERWNLLLQIRDDGIQTVRSTSPVVEVSHE